MIGFRQKLKERQEKIDSLVCIGLDPLPEKIPARFKSSSTTSLQIVNWMNEIVDKTAPYASMFKLQIAHWEAVGGSDFLGTTIFHIKQRYPDIPVFIDCKRGDIGRTQACYATALFDLAQADGVNFNPYMGKDCMEGLAKYPGKALVGLCYTSNQSAREMQNVVLLNGKYYWEFVAERVLEWSQELGVTENAGLVMAAAYLDGDYIIDYHLTSCRKIVKDKLWFLIPGIGTQGGCVERTVLASYMGYGSIALSSSSDIIFSDDPAAKAQELRDQIIQCLKEYYGNV